MSGSESISVASSPLEGRYPEGGPGDPRGSPEREREPSRSRRPRLLRDRSRHRAARPRPPAQAHRQDRFRPLADRRRHLRLLRGDGRTDLAEAPRSPAHRHAVARSAGAPRAQRAGLPRRLTRIRSSAGGSAGRRKGQPETRGRRSSSRSFALTLSGRELIFLPTVTARDLALRPKPAGTLIARHAFSMETRHRGTSS